MNANLSSSSHDSAPVNTNVTNQTNAVLTTTHGERRSIYPKTINLPVPSNERVQDSETTVTASSVQDDSHFWAHSVSSAPIARRTIGDERPSEALKISETNVSHMNRYSLLILFVLKR